MQYKVIINGKDSGIIETNYIWATNYWSIRAVTIGPVLLQSIANIRPTD